MPGISLQTRQRAIVRHTPRHTGRIGKPGFSRILGKPVQVVEAPLASIVPTFTSFGMSADIAGLFRKMYEGVREGRVAAEAGEHVRGTTPLETTLRELLGAAS